MHRFFTTILSKNILSLKNNFKLVYPNVVAITLQSQRQFSLISSKESKYGFISRNTVIFSKVPTIEQRRSVFNFKALQKGYNHFNSDNNNVPPSINQNARLIGIVVVAILGFGSLIVFNTNKAPITGRRRVILVSKHRELQMMNSYYSILKKQYAKGTNIACKSSSDNKNKRNC